MKIKKTPLIFFLLVFTYILSYSQQSLGYYIGYNEVPKEFKERYFSKGHPDFYPKHVGDMWQYVYYDIPNDTLRYYEIKIVSDTVVNGKTYFNRANTFFRTKDGSSPEDYGTEYALDIRDLDQDGILNDNLLIDSLSAEIGVPYISFADEVFGGTPKMVGDSAWYIIGNDTLLSIETDGFGGVEIYTDNMWITTIYPEESFPMYLNGAIINGVVYGTIVDVVEEGEDLPVNYRLSQNHPNPFNPTTTIEYSIPNVVTENFSPQRNIQLIVYDVLGREIATLVNEKQSAGNYSVKFDASNLPSGIYFYKLQAGNFVSIKKMVLTK